ncbi:MAG: helix-turn-helix transcriptional regulator [Micromonosporaceae bacterium]|nr:helix-turn-helix transcriptional regulator [Micromonosporaceae bacterium]
MPDDPPLRPRQQLGRRLRQLRLLAGLSGVQLAKRIGRTQAYVSRLETGAHRPRVDVIHAWLQATEASEADCQDVQALAAAAQIEVTGWRAVFRGTLAGRQHQLIAQDAQATSVRHFQPYQVPGPFHTAAYATAAFRSIRSATEDDLETAVATRLERGRRMRQPGAPTYHAILTEPALWWRPTGVSEADRTQLWRSILVAAETPHLTVQVIRTTTPMDQAPMCAFIITDFPTSADEPTIVDVELPPVEMTFAGETDVAAFELAWKRMLAAALSPEDSLAFVQGLIDQHGS